ncbi:hypothetical protein GCM10028805_65750 [Spirosoma harenae]
MKNLRYLLYSILICVIAFEACRNPLEDVTLALKDPLQDGVIEIRLYDPAQNPLPQQNQVTIAGPNADQIVTTLNTRSFKVNSDGHLLIAPSPSAKVSDKNPLRYTVVVESPDYLTVILPITQTSLEQQVRTVRRINLTKPPSTVAANRANGRAGTDGIVANAFGVTTTQSTNDADRSLVTVPAGTKVVDRNGQPVSNELTLAVIHTNARTSDATRYIPGEGAMSNVAGRNGGASLGTLRVLSLAGSLAIQLYTNQYALANSFSQPIPWTMDLNPALSNFSKGRAVQEGDSIPLFSYDEFADRWQAETPGVVVRNAQTNRLECRANARLAATYVAGWAESICDIGPVFKVNSQLASVDVNYLCKLINVSTNQQISSFYANINNGSIITIRNQPKNLRLKLQVFDETDTGVKGPRGLISESTPGQTCDPNPIVINLTALEVPPDMTLAIEYACPNGTTLNEALIPALVKIQYSEVGKGQWKDLATVTRKQRTTTSYKLQVGQSYDFRASIDGGASWLLRQDNYRVDKSDWTLTIRADIFCR